MVMEHWWNGTAEEKPKYLEKNLSHYSFFHYRSLVGCPEVEPGPPR
jgi:hypothetical protein